MSRCSSSNGVKIEFELIERSQHRMFRFFWFKPCCITTNQTMAAMQQTQVLEEKKYEMVMVPSAEQLTPQILKT